VGAFVWQDCTTTLEESHLKEEFTMLRWAVIFLVVALVAAVLGFGGIAGTAAGIAQFLFFLFLVLFVVALIFGRRVINA
jgi:uncharacterized membrane protein YtjA (UPF0391 family)